MLGDDTEITDNADTISNNEEVFVFSSDIKYIPPSPQKVCAVLDNFVCSRERTIVLLIFSS